MADEAIQTRKKKRSTAKGKFHRIFRRLNDSVSEDEESSVLKEILTDLEKAYKELEERHDDLQESLSDDDKIAELNDDMDIMYKELCSARSSTVKHREGKERKPAKGTELTKNVRVKKLDAPSFSGGIRCYPSFKRDFETHMSPVFGKDSFALKRCLSGEALLTVMGVDDDFDDMFRRLDLKYGRPEKLTDAILTEIRKLKKIPDDDPSKLIGFVDTIEKCWLDLKRMNLEAEMNTATMISQIEKLLPNLQKREWALRKQKLLSKKSNCCFSMFMDFLLEEKYAIEYMESDIRESGTTTNRHKIHTAISSDDHDSENQQDIGLMNSLKIQMQENQQMLQQVVEGLAQVAQVVTGSNETKSNISGIRRKKCWFHDTDSHEIASCTSFSQLDNQSKMNLLKQNGVCFSCLKPGHISSKCINRRPCEALNEFRQKCGRMHHPALHSLHAEGMSFHNSLHMVNSKEQSRSVLLMISTVLCNRVSVTTLWDPGANMTLITHNMAKYLGLKGKEVSLSITKVGNVTELIQSKEYVVPLTDKSGVIWEIRAFGMDEVTAEVGNVDVRQVATLFRGISENDIARPTGRVDLLIGTDCCIILPNKVEQIGNLQLKENQFGYCIRGNHDLIRTSPICNSHSLIQIHFASTKPCDMNDTQVMYSKQIKSCLDSFFDIESLGTNCIPRCGSCKCGKCSIGSQNYTIQEEREMKMIEEGLKYDDENKRWVAKYPWKRSASDLPNNFIAARARMFSTERRLRRVDEQLANAYNEQIHDMVDRRVARKLTDYEIASYKGPVHYIPHQEVLKPESASTPIRIVFNSSASFMGHVLNEYWAKGPNVINDLLGVVLRFRQFFVALAGDISKMYNTVRISEIDQHTHRFLWRDLDSNKDPEHYVLQTVTFGDKPSGIIATVALRKTAEMCRYLYPAAADIIERNSYVDDVLHSVESVEEAKKLAVECDTILSEGSFHIKHWIIPCIQTTNTDSEMKLNLLHSKEEKILGMIWDTRQDSFKYKAKVNFSVKRKNIHREENLKRDDIPSAVPSKLTRRMVLSQVASIFDPLGLITPYVLEAKILMRDMCIKDKSSVNPSETRNIWDQAMTDDSRQLWINFFARLFEIEDTEFHRCLKPKCASGEPMLVIFSDSSTLAYGTCAYIRWKIGFDRYEARLIMAKNRIAPTRQLSVPRLELCGAVLACRLREKLQKEMTFKFCRVVHIVDSMIVRVQIQKESYGFGTFVATRVAEIQSKTEPSEWWWVPSGQNPADLTTRVTQVKNLGINSVWQNGPNYLTQPFELWPISQTSDIECSQLPNRIGVTMLATVVNNNNDSSLNFGDILLERFSRYDKLLKVTSLVLSIARSKSFVYAKRSACKIDSCSAELEWIKFLQNELPKDWRVRYKRLGVAVNDQGLVVVGNRMADWLTKTWNQTEFILLPMKGRFIYLLVKSVHDRDHSGVETTLAKLRSKYWIPGVRRLIKTVRSKCVRCKKLDKPKLCQQMGRLPLERLSSSPAFYYCAVDLFGPFVIKDTVKKRTHSKAYGVIFNCLSSRAVYVDCADGYDTDSFMLVLRRFISLRGYPRKMLSDAGSQLVSAKNEISQMSHQWNWETIESFGKNSGMEWELTKSADAPWENGCSEALVKSVKRCLLCTVGSSILSFSELQTVFFEVANSLNERPIGTKTNDPNEGSYLCPNDLILGRSTVRVPGGVYNEHSCFRIRWKFVQQLVSSFWYKWQRDCFPTLIIRQKWHTSTRNLVVGDVVLVQDSNVIRGQWKLAQVCEAEPGRDGKVRDVRIRYKVQGPGSAYYGVQDTFVRRSVHKLVVILPVEEQAIKQ